MSDTIEQKCITAGVKLTDQRRIIARILSESKEIYGESDHPDVDELYSRVPKLVSMPINDKSNSCSILNFFSTDLTRFEFCL